MSGNETPALPQIPGYETISRLGSGGMSNVFKARDAATGQMVALKILGTDFAISKEDIKRFEDEERLLETIDHPGIVKGYKMGFVAATYTWYYAMEYVDGYDFSALLKRKQHLKEEDCLLICESAALALEYAWNEHRIVHCDIKPDNILINTAGEIKLADLGLSRICSGHMHLDGNHEGKDAGFVMGTPDFISPEQVYGDVELDCRADIYSLAATTYKLATGRSLFPGMDADAKLRAHCDETAQAKDPRHYRPELSEGFCRMLEAMLVKDRDGRTQTWNEVYAMCLDIENGAAPEQRQQGWASSIVIDA